MTIHRVKTSAYLNKNLYERAKLYSNGTALPFNTHLVLALEQYLKDPEKQAIIQETLEKQISEEESK